MAYLASGWEHRFLFYVQLIKFFHYLEKKFNVTPKGDKIWTHQIYLKLQESKVNFEEMKDVDEVKLFISMKSMI